MSTGVFFKSEERGDKFNKIKRLKRKRRGSLKEMDSVGGAAAIGHACP